MSTHMDLTVWLQQENCKNNDRESSTLTLECTSKEGIMTLYFQKTPANYFCYFLNPQTDMHSDKIRITFRFQFDEKQETIILKLHYVPLIFLAVYSHTYVISHKVSAFEKNQNNIQTPTPPFHLAQVWKKENVTPMILKSQMETKEWNFFISS